MSIGNKFLTVTAFDETLLDLKQFIDYYVCRSFLEGRMLFFHEVYVIVLPAFSTKLRLRYFWVCVIQ